MITENLSTLKIHKLTKEQYDRLVASGNVDQTALYMVKDDTTTDDVGGNANINVTATVGQTIVVDEVDENGKPTEWKAADYQPRTHWSEIVDGDILPITEFTSVYEESMGINMAQLPLCELEVGKTYTVIYDGVTYTCIAKTGEMNGMAYVGVGNDMFFGGEQTSEPFGVAYVESSSITGVIPLVEGTHTVRIIGEIPVTHKIPREYLYSKTIDFEWGGEDSGSWMVYSKSNLDITIQDIVEEVKSGVMYYARITAPASITGLDYDLPLVMPSIAYNDAMPYGTITGYSVSFECTAVNKQFSLDLMYIPGVAEAGLISFKTLVNTDTAVVTPESASVGQTIVVDKVNANGKPSKWKAVDHQERTHGSKWVELLPETTLTFTNSQYQGAHNVLIEPGKTYKVLWNGTEYILTASYFNLGTMAGNGLGNQAAIGGTDTGEPFMLGTNVEGTTLLCIELTGATSATVSIVSEEITMIPPKYLPDGIGYEIIENVLPATSATYLEDGADKYFYVRLSPELIIGQNYLVNLNGTVYNCTAYVLNGSDIPVLGNANLMGVEDYNTGEPFCLFALPAIGRTYIYMEDPIPSFLTVSITSVDRHRIPTKYLPDGIGYDNSEVILPLTDLRYVDEEIDKYFAADVPSLMLIEGDVYDVNYNGILYQCTAKVPEGSDVTILGNLDIMGLGVATDEPFLIVNTSSRDNVYLYTNEVYGDTGITKAILSIVHNALHKIPEKYLPDHEEIDTSAIIASAKEYTDSVGETTLASSKEYTDQKLEERKVNGKPLSSDVNLTASDVGAATPEDITNAINALPKVVTSGSYNDLKDKPESELPTVTADDNGAFLRVVNGVWAVSYIPNVEEGEF